MEKSFNKYTVIGWVGVVVSTGLSCVWAFWGIIENYHEGWYYRSWLPNVGMMLGQYLSPMLIFMVITLVSIFWPRLGGCVHGILAVLVGYFFRAFSNAAVFLIIVPMIGLGALYWFGRPRPRKIAVAAVVGLPVLALIIFGTEPALRVSQRVDDGNLHARVVQGNGVRLTWAPDGPGWPSEGGNWYEARQACLHLNVDGLILEGLAQSIWRLPTVEEVVRSSSLHGQNSAGVWNAETASPVYVTIPDKESPLWNIYSQVIYWWTATEVDTDHAYMIVYDGKVWSRSKQFGPAYLGYRCVK